MNNTDEINKPEYTLIMLNGKSGLGPQSANVTFFRCTDEG